MTTECFILARAVHFSACLLSFGLLIFDRLVIRAALANPEIAGTWRSKVRSLQLFLLPIILLSGIGWFLLVTLNMGDGSWQGGAWKLVWTQTQFGLLWHWRLRFWTAWLPVFAGSFFRPWKPCMAAWFTSIQLGLSGLLLGSLAWAGHGRETSDWHLLADILHLLVAGCWPTGLLPLLLMWRQLSSASGGRQAPWLAMVVGHFSTLSLVSVTLLSVTGLVNGWFLVGSFSNLFSDTYGRWLLLKILLFVIALGFGAMNLLRWKSHLTKPDGSVAANMRRNILFELILAGIVIIIVAVLGILPPAIGF